MSSLNIAGSLLVLTLSVLVVLACGYYLAVSVAAWRLRRRKPFETSTERPGVTILKPVRGCDPNLLESIRTHAAQDYPNLEIIFGLSGPDDPAIGPIERLIHEFPERRIELVICNPESSGNAKAAVLDQIEKRARFEIFLVSDSDVALAPDHLSKAVTALLQPDVGMVCSLYEGRPAGGWASRFEAALVTAEFQGQVLLARMLQGIRFGLGAAMLFRRADLAAAGGFRALTYWIGDDYELGARLSHMGRRIVISDAVVQTSLGAHSWRGVWRHQLRWSRTIRSARPAGHFGLLFTHGTVWSILLLAAAGGSAGLSALAVGCVGLRLFAAWQVVSRTLHSRHGWRHTLLAIPGDVLGFAVWIASYFGRRVFWRGRWLRLGRGGRIIDAVDAPPPRSGLPSTAPVND